MIEDNGLRLFNRQALQIIQRALSRNTKIAGNTVYCCVDNVTVIWQREFQISLELETQQC